MGLYKKIKSGIKSRYREHQINKRQVAVATRIMEQKARAKALKEREKQTIKTFVAREKLKGKQEREMLKPMKKAKKKTGMVGPDLMDMISKL